MSKFIRLSHAVEEVKYIVNIDDIRLVEETSLEDGSRRTDVFFVDGNSMVVSNSLDDIEKRIKL